MDISQDHLRREAQATQDDQDRAVRGFRQLLARVFDGNNAVDAETKSGLVVPGGVNRRGFLKVGGLTVAGAAIFAACGGDDTEDEGAAGGDTTDTTEGGKGSEKDITILRTASSLEELAVAAYQMGIDSGLVTTAAVADAAKLFQAQHKEHSELFKGATTAMGGEAFAEPNPAVLAQLDPAIKALKTEKDVLKLAYDLESAAAATYFSTAGQFDDIALNEAAMSVGGIEARHVAILGGVLGLDQFPKAGFQTADGAVAAGTGVS